MDKRFKWTKDQEQFLIDNYSKYGRTFCAKALDFTISKVGHKAARLELKVSPELISARGVANTKRMWSDSPNPNLFNVDYRPFVESFTNESAYLLGYLWADGYLNNMSASNRISLEIIEKDASEITEIFNTTGKWAYSRRERSNRQPQVTFSANNYVIYKYLVLNDYEVKSRAAPTKILEALPQNLHKHWWRGYFDGDGCFYYNILNSCHHASFSGSYDQDWSEVTNLFTNLGVRFKVTQVSSKNGHRSSNARICNKADYLKLGEYLYKDYDGMGLRRKYNKWSEVKDYLSGGGHYG